MRFHGLMLLRDEEDIIGECLDHLLTWIDALYIMDLGSTDQTWEIVQEYARQDERVVPFMHEPIIYGDNLRSVHFNRFRDRFEAGDWIMKIDADEFYPTPPPEFVRECVRESESAVFLQWYFFRITDREVAAYESGETDLHEDRKRSIQDRRRYFQIAEYSEPRMFRYRPSMRWHAENYHPYNAGFVARRCIPILHYPHRDPVQLQRRYQLRAAMKQHRAKAGGHWDLEDWRQDVVPIGANEPDRQTADASSGRRSEKRTGVSQMRGLDSDRLRFWKPGEELPPVDDRSHLAAWPKRLIQRIIHPLLLPLLDRTRPEFDPSYQPRRLTHEENDAIGRMMR